jgi:co-chaperonin GroES (HSP10)
VKKVKPVGHRVLIQVDPPDTTEKKSASGIIVHVETRNKDHLEMATDTGVILAMGSTVNKEFLDGAKVGDRVIFSRYEGCAKKYDDQLIRLINDESVWGIVED